MIRFFQILMDYIIIKRSGLFDKAFYLGQFRDLLPIPRYPLLHYLRYGGDQGFFPSETFNSDFYLSSYPDVKESKINPLVHYIKHGRAEGRLPYQDHVSDILLKSFNTENQSLTIDEGDDLVASSTEFTNWNRKEVKFVRRSNQHWLVTSSPGIKFLQRECLATELGKTFVNVVDVAPLSAQDILTLQNLGVISSSHTRNDTLLRRLAQSYTITELPCRSLDSAAAGEFVFSVWIRRNDPNEFNRVYLENGVPVFFDLNASMNFEGNSEAIEDFFANQNYGHGGRWRIRLIGEFPAETIALRKRSENMQYYTIQSVQGFTQEIKTITDFIKDYRFDFQDILQQTGFLGTEAEYLYQFLTNNQINLQVDVQKALEFVFSFPLTTLTQ